MHGLSKNIKEKNIPVNPLEKIGKNKTIKDFINKIRNPSISLSYTVDKDNNSIQKGDNIIIKQRKSFKIYEDLTNESNNDKSLNKNKSIKSQNSGYSINSSISRNHRTLYVDTVNLVEDESKKQQSIFSKLSVKPSKYILSQKIIKSINIIEGNIKDNFPNRIISGYQNEKNKKIYLIDWKTRDEQILLPSFVKSETLKIDNSAMIVEYLENYIIKNN
jgi:hypothetical protein